MTSISLRKCIYPVILDTYLELAIFYLFFVEEKKSAFIESSSNVYFSRHKLELGLNSSIDFANLLFKNHIFSAISFRLSLVFRYEFILYKVKSTFQFIAWLNNSLLKTLEEGKEDKVGKRLNYLAS